MLTMFLQKCNRLQVSPLFFERLLNELCIQSLMYTKHYFQDIHSYKKEELNKLEQTVMQK